MTSATIVSSNDVLREGTLTDWLYTKPQATVCEPWHEHYCNLDHIIIDGYEPLNHDKTYEVINYLTALPRPDLALTVKTRFSSPLYNDFLGSIAALCQTQHKAVTIQIKLESVVQPTFEYFRPLLSGIRYHSTKTAIYLLMALCKQLPNLKVEFLIDVNLLTVGSSFYETIRFIDHCRGGEKYAKQVTILFEKNITVPFLDANLIPNFGSLSAVAVQFADHANSIDFEYMLTTDERAKLVDIADGILRYPSNIGLGPKFWHVHAGFYRYMTAYDHKFSCEFTKAFPKLNLFWGFCEYAANNY